MDNFKAAFEHIMRPEHDGQGYHVTPGDSGGMTAWGITERTYSGWLGRPVTEADMRTLTQSIAESIYLRNYWEIPGCYTLPDGLDVMVFDFGCGSGPHVAVTRLQRVLGVAEDGIIGPITRGAIDKYVRDGKLVELLRAYHAQRLTFYGKLSTYPLFGRGWAWRADRCLALALRLATRAPSSGAPQALEPTLFIGVFPGGELLLSTTTQFTSWRLIKPTTLEVIKFGGKE